MVFAHGWCRERTQLLLIPGSWKPGRGILHPHGEVSGQWWRPGSSLESCWETKSWKNMGSHVQKWRQQQEIAQPFNRNSGHICWLLLPLFCPVPSAILSDGTAHIQSMFFPCWWLSPLASHLWKHLQWLPEGQCFANLIGTTQPVKLIVWIHPHICLTSAFSWTISSEIAKCCFKTLKRSLLHNVTHVSFEWLFQKQ